MANSEDVLNWPEVEFPELQSVRALRRTVTALAAEVRELRRDRERLDVLETIIAMRKIVGGPWEGCLPSTHSISAHSLRDLADAAMGGGEGEA